MSDHEGHVDDCCSDPSTPMEAEPVVDDAPAEKLPAYVAGPDAVDISPKQDGGIMKEIRRPGVGDEHPMTGDKVFVHYVGTLTDGTKFDSSRDRGQKFDFELGMGKVIKAWDVGVATMKRGELAVLLCKSEYAYGKGGSPPKIPADATLVFEVELFDWKGEDVSEKKDEGVIRRKISNGEGYMTPKDGASCEIHIVGRHAGRVFEDRDVTFVVGDGSEVGIVDGVDQAIKKFKKGEKSLLKVTAKYAYGSVGSPTHDIPADADLEFEVELKKFEKAKESWEMDVPEKLEQSEISKNKGTDFFKAGKFKLAAKYYSRIVELLKGEETTKSLKDDEVLKRNTLMLAAHLNLAMCHLKLGEDVEALHSCDEALQLDPQNEKGLFRRGTANQNLQNFDDALKDFTAVLAVDPDNKAAKNQLAVTGHKLKQIREREKQIFAGMFQKFAEIDAKKEKLNPAPPAEPKPNNAEPHSDSESLESEPSEPIPAATDSSAPADQPPAEPMTASS